MVKYWKIEGNTNYCNWKIFSRIPDLLNELEKYRILFKDLKRNDSFFLNKKAISRDK